MRKATTNVRPLGDLLRVFVGPGLWAIHFAIMYGAEGLICPALPAAQGSIMIWTASVASLAVLTALVVYATTLARQWSSADLAAGSNSIVFLRSLALLLALLSMVGVIWTTLPLVFLSACTPPAG
jgi:hypothetical protein